MYKEFLEEYEKIGGINDEKSKNFAENLEKLRWIKVKDTGRYY